VKLIIASLLLLGTAVHSLGQTTGKASANGTCNAVNTGNSSTLRVQCGVGKNQAEKIIRLLNAVLAKRDALQINAKLDELLDIANRPGIVINGPFQGNAAGINYGQQVFNQFSERPTLKQFVVQIETTCSLANPGKIPQDVTMAFGGDPSYLQGKDKALLTGGPYTFKPTSDKNTYIAVQAFSLNPASTPIGTPLKEFAEDYSILHVNNFATSGGYFRECSHISIRITLNGTEALHVERPMSLQLAGMQGIDFNLTLRGD
jgi:hypothetical protein